jgi:hypothetical protein
LFWSTVRVIVESSASAQGIIQLSSPEIGTAFVVDSAAHGPRERLYLVTARHVVETSEDGTLVFVRHGAPDESRLLEFTRKPFRELWFYPKDRGLDVAITPLGSGEVAKFLQADSVKIVAIPMLNQRSGYGWWLSRAVLRDFEEVFFDGYPLGNLCTSRSNAVENAV